MPRLRLAARLLRVRSSPWGETCASCEAASAGAAAGTSFSPSSPLDPSSPSSRKPTTSSSPSSPLDPSSPLSRKPTSFSAPLWVEVEEERFRRVLGIFPHQAATTVARDRSSWHAHSSRPLVGCLPLSGSSSFRDPHHGLIIGVKHRVSLLGQRPRNPCGLHSFSVVYANDTTTDSGHDLHDGQEQHEHAIPNSSRTEDSVVSPSLQICEEEEETEVVGHGEEFFSRHEDTPAPANERRFTALLYDEEEEGEEVTTEWDASLLTSSEDESDLSELEFVEINSGPRDLDDGELEAGEGRPEEEEATQWTGSMLERMPLAASTEKEVGTSELVSDFLDVVSTAGEGFRDGGLIESEPHGDHQDRLPYLHTLSVDEVREILEKTRAKDVRILQVEKCCEWVDHLIFASGRSFRHLRGMADAIVYRVKQRSENVGPNSFPLVEGRDGEQWMAIDCGDIVIHLFLEEARSYYNLEEFWAKKSNPRLVETY